MKMKSKKKIIGIIAVLVIMLTSADNLFSDPPPWAPAHGYRAKRGFEYFPDPNIYYDYHRGGYFYMEGDNWRFGIELPLLYSKFDLMKARRVYYHDYVDYPYRYNDWHPRHARKGVFYEERYDRHRDFDK